MTFRISAAVLILSAALGLAATSAKAASFDCAKASQADERAICSTPELSVLDSEMAGLWFAFSKVPMLMGGNGARMDDAQGFLKQRAQCGNNLACLRPLYHARIDALKQGVAQAMNDYFQLQNADPQVLPWAVANLPDPVGRIAGRYADDCKKLGGTLAQGADQPKVITGDIDADGTQDFVLDPETMDCSAAATAFCGNGGCQIRIAVSSDNYEKPVEALGGQPTLALTGEGPRLSIWVDGTNCKFSGRDKACWADYRWQNGKAEVTHRLRPIVE